MTTWKKISTTLPTDSYRPAIAILLRATAITIISSSNSSNSKMAIRRRLLPDWPSRELTLPLPPPPCRADGSIAAPFTRNKKISSAILKNLTSISVKETTLPASGSDARESSKPSTPGLPQAFSFQLRPSALSQA